MQLSRCPSRLLQEDEGPWHLAGESLGIRFDGPRFRLIIGTGSYRYVVIKNM